MVADGPGSARRLLGVFAHPDDEVFCAGGTIAQALAAGAEVLIVSATRGEQGQIRDPAAATRPTLGAVRERELRAAAAELGVQSVQVLAYADGTLEHHRSSLGDAVADVMRRFDPDTVITFGADGGSGHPGTSVIEQGEPAHALYLIIDGTADALLERPRGQVTRLRHLQRRVPAGPRSARLPVICGRLPSAVEPAGVKPLAWRFDALRELTGAWTYVYGVRRLPLAGVARSPGVKDVDGLIPTSPAYPFHPNRRGEQVMAAQVLAALGA